MAVGGLTFVLTVSVDADESAAEGAVMTEGVIAVAEEGDAISMAGILDDADAGEFAIERLIPCVY